MAPTIDFREMRSSAADDAIPFELSDGWRALAAVAREHLRELRSDDAAQAASAKEARS